jgi:nitrite reductase/ring-hydroxylating ferredoxin subunit
VSGRVGLTDVDVTSAVGTIVAVTHDGIDVAVIRYSEGWVLVPDECTHASCPFTTDAEVVDGTVLVCNCHGSEWDLRTGELLAGPAELPLAVVALSDASGALRQP